MGETATSGERRIRRHRVRQRTRTAVEAAVFVVALFFAGWGADALARYGAEALLSRNIQNATGVTEPPTVDVQGFAFLPQVVRGAYAEVEVTTRGVTSGPLRIDRVDSQLVDVRVPFHDVLVQDIRRVGIGRSIEDVTLRYEDLNAYFADTGRQLRLSPADDGQVRLEGRVVVLGQEVEVATTATLAAVDETLRLRPQEIDVGGAALNQASQLLVRQRLTLRVPLGTLPFGHQLSDVTVTPEAVRLRAEGTAVIIQP